jgi:hypothetical protein
MTPFKPQHHHLIVRGFFLNPPKSCDILNNWFIELVNLVGMKVAAGPTSVYVDDLGNEGVTGTITLSTSHASIHVWDNETPSLFQFDIYSCKLFDVYDVIGKLNDFDLYDYDCILLDRNDGLHIVSTMKKT